MDQNTEMVTYNNPFINLLRVYNNYCFYLYRVASAFVMYRLS